MSIDKKPRTLTGDEVDLIHAKKYYNYPAGRAAAIKRKMNRRFRQEGKKDLTKTLITKEGE